MLHQRLAIADLALIMPKKHEDARGFFMEAYRDEWFRANIADVGFAQDNQSLSVEAGTIRGLHYQKAPMGQGKLVRCVSGALFDVAVDIRSGSRTFGQWVGVTLTAENAYQLWIPEGFAYGFCTLAPHTEVVYKVTRPYSQDCDAGVAFDDSDIGIQWPIDVREAVLSHKDRLQPKLITLLGST